MEPQKSSWMRSSRAGRRLPSRRSSDRARRAARWPVDLAEHGDDRERAGAFRLISSGITQNSAHSPGPAGYTPRGNRPP